jgi:hypothetical protein
MNICNNTTVTTLPFDALEAPQGHHTVKGMTSWKLELREGLDRSDIGIPMQQQSTVTLWDLDQDLKQETAALPILSASSVNCDAKIIAPIGNVRRTQSVPCDLYRVANTMEATVFPFSTIQHRAINHVNVTINRPAAVDPVSYFDHDCSSVSSDISMDDMDVDDDDEDDDDKLSGFYLERRGSHHRGDHGDADLPACRKLEEDCTSILGLVSLSNRVGIVDVDDVTPTTNTAAFTTHNTHQAHDDGGLFTRTMTRGRSRHGVIHDPTLVRPVREQNNDGFRGARGVSLRNMGTILLGDIMMDDPTLFRPSQQGDTGVLLVGRAQRLAQHARGQSRRSLFRDPRGTGVLRMFRRGGGGGDPRSAFYADPTIYDYRGGDDETVDSWVDAVENGELDDERVISFGSRVLKVLGVVHRARPPLVRRLGRV